MNGKSNGLLKIVYAVIAIVALFTGFGNMPLWKRYYVADVPGLGWSGDFFINVNVHILAGSILLAIGIYAIIVYIVKKTHYHLKLTLSGKIRGALMCLALITGILMVVKNLPGVHFSLNALMVFNFTHMGAAVLFMIMSIIALFGKRSWWRAQ